MIRRNAIFHILSSLLSRRGPVWLSRRICTFQARELPVELGNALLGDAPEELKARALDAYRRRFATSRPDAGCLNVASAGQSAVVLTVLSGQDQFQVCLAPHPALKGKHS